MSTVTLAQQNVVAAFRDLELAEEGLTALRDAGFTEDELSLLGQPPEEVEDRAEDEHGPGEPVGGSIFTHVATGGVAGGLAGGVLGALATAAVVSLPGIGIVAGTGALIGFVGGAGAGSTVGSILEGEAALRGTSSWNQVLDAVKEGAIVIGVHTAEEDRIQQATRVLEPFDPMDIRRVNSSGETITTAT